MFWWCCYCIALIACADQMPPNTAVHPNAFVKNPQAGKTAFCFLACLLCARQANSCSILLHPKFLPNDGSLWYKENEGQFFFCLCEPTVLFCNRESKWNENEIAPKVRPMKIQCNCLSQYAISGWNIYFITSEWYSLKQIFFSITFPLLHTPDCMLLNKACNLKPQHKSQFLNHLSEYIHVYPDISVYIRIYPCISSSQHFC